MELDTIDGFNNPCPFTLGQIIFYPLTKCVVGIDSPGFLLENALSF
jgi:hypothetical protein